MLYTIPHTLPYHTIPYQILPYRTVLYYTIAYQYIPHTLPYHTIQCYTISILYYTTYATIGWRRCSRYIQVPYLTILYHAKLYCAILHHTIPYHIYTRLYCAI